VRVKGAKEMIFMTRSNHRRDYLAKRMSSNLGDAGDVPTPLASSGDGGPHQAHATSARRQSLVAWGLMAGVVAIPVIFLLVLLI
jgi:hypothetical protein